MQPALTPRTCRARESRREHGEVREVLRLAPDPRHLSPVRLADRLAELGPRLRDPLVPLEPRPAVPGVEGHAHGCDLRGWI